MDSAAGQESPAREQAAQCVGRASASHSSRRLQHEVPRTQEGVVLRQLRALPRHENEVR